MWLLEQLSIRPLGTSWKSNSTHFRRIMELIPNLHWFKGLGSNIYLMANDDGHILVDTGSPWDTNRIYKYFDDHGLDVKAISVILITHADIDHSGSAAALQAASDAKVVAGEKTAELIKLGKSPNHLPRFVQRLADLIHYAAVPEEAIEVVDNQEFIGSLDGWQAVATPGHCIDHFSYFLHSEGLLFAGDALYAWGQLDIGRSFFTGDQDEARRSAVALLKLAPAVIACGHGPPVMDHMADETMLLSRRLQS